MIDPGGRIRLADFGIAKPLDDAATITSPGDMVGTISYVAPEIIGGEKASAASDIYSLAAVAYEMLTGEKPFQADTTAGLLEAIRQATGPSSLERFRPGHPGPGPGYGPGPSDRPGSAEAFAAELSNPPLWSCPLGALPVVRPVGAGCVARFTEEPTVLCRNLPVIPITGGVHSSRPSEAKGNSGRMFAAAGGLALLVVIAALTSWVAMARPRTSEHVPIHRQPRLRYDDHHRRNDHFDSRKHRSRWQRR